MQHKIWYFEPYPHSPFIWRNQAYGLLAIALIGGFWYGLLQIPMRQLFALKVLSLILTAYFVCKMIREWHNTATFGSAAEYIKMDELGFHFRIYPSSGSLKYHEIIDLAHWYIPYAESRYEIYDRDIGIIIRTKHQTIQLDLTRLKRDDDVIFENTSRPNQRLPEAFKPP